MQLAFSEKMADQLFEFLFLYSVTYLAPSLHCLKVP